MPCKSHLSPFKPLELIGLNILLLFVPAPGSFVPFVHSSLGNSTCKSIIRFYRHLAQGDTDLPCEPLQAGFSWDVCRQSPSVWSTVVRKAWSNFFKGVTEGKNRYSLDSKPPVKPETSPFDLLSHWWQALWENTYSLSVPLGYLLLILWPAPFWGGRSQSNASINRCPLHLFLSQQLTSLQPWISSLEPPAWHFQP